MREEGDSSSSSSANVLLWRERNQVVVKLQEISSVVQKLAHDAEKLEIDIKTFTETTDADNDDEILAGESVLHLCHMMSTLSLTQCKLNGDETLTHHPAHTNVLLMEFIMSKLTTLKELASPEWEQIKEAGMKDDENVWEDDVCENIVCESDVCDNKSGEKAEESAETLTSKFVYESPPSRTSSALEKIRNVMNEGKKTPTVDESKLYRPPKRVALLMGQAQVKPKTKTEIRKEGRNKARLLNTTLAKSLLIDKLKDLPQEETQGFFGETSKGGELRNLEQILKREKRKQAYQEDNFLLNRGKTSKAEAKELKKLKSYRFKTSSGGMMLNDFANSIN